jgi:uncharacterized protein (DUF169 family)
MRTDTVTPGTRLIALLGDGVQAVAIQFAAAPPPGLSRVSSPGPAGCGYWRLAAEGRAFYTEPSDHHQCPVGAIVLGIVPPPEVAAELRNLLHTMGSIGYLRPDEAAGLPHLDQEPRYIAYAPLAGAPFPPDLILVRGSVRQLMLMAEAAQSAGLLGDGPTLGRPTCAALPAALQSGRMTASLGCVGNRVYTGAADGEAYCVLPAGRLGTMVSALETIVAANRTLEEFHRGRAAARPLSTL